MLDLAAAQAKYEETQSFCKQLRRALEETGYADKYNEILRYLETNRHSTPKRLYTGSLKQFGREAGVGIYRILKKVV